MRRAEVAAGMYIYHVKPISNDMLNSEESIGKFAIIK